MIGALFLAIPRTSLGISVYEREVIRRKCGTQEARQCDGHLNGCQKLGRLSCQTEQAFCSFISLLRHPFQFCFVYGKYRNLCTSKNCIYAINIICNKNNTNIFTSFCNNNILSSKKQKTQPMHGFQCTSRVLTSISEQIDFVIASVRVRTTVACIHFVISPSFPQYNIFYYRIALWLCHQLLHQQSVSRDFLTVS